MSSKKGCIKTKFVVNFRKKECDIIQEMAHLYKNGNIAPNIASFGTNLLQNLDSEHFSPEDVMSLNRISNRVLGNITEKNNLSSVLTDNLEELFQASEIAHVPQFHSKLAEIFMDKILSNLEQNHQNQIFKKLGSLLNKPIYEKCQEFVDPKNLDLKYLIKASKEIFYLETDPRLVAFIDGVTETDRYKSDHNAAEKLNYKANAVENLMKARRKNTITPTGLREHIAVYFASDRNRSVSEIFSKMGTKGTRTTIELVMKNSMETSKFKIPEQTTVFVSFDNVQKLFKIHRLHQTLQSKAIGIVVTSIVSILPDGLVSSNVQYVLRHSPTAWLHKYELNKESLHIVEKLDKDALKKIVKISDDDLKLVLGRFEYDLERALKKVESEMNKDGLDIIDKVVKDNFNANHRTCMNGHLNENVRGNRKYCTVCKDTFEEIETVPDLFEVVLEGKSSDGIFKAEIKEPKDKSIIYPDVRNIFPENNPIIKSNGVVYVNPNKPARVAKVLKYLQTETGTQRAFVSSVRVSENGEIVSKAWNIRGARSFILVTVDGLPYKICMDLIKNYHECVTCGKEFKNLADVTTHVTEVNHREFFKTFGNIVLNIGEFHYGLTMLRSYVKLIWHMDLSYLCKTINFDSPKAQLVQLKVADFHKSWDTFLASHEAKTLELCYPFVKHALKQGIPVTIQNYNRWKNWFVKSETYNLVYDIESYFGTCVWMFANNYDMALVSRRLFSGLFHINNNPNYSVIDIHYDYLMTMCMKNAPELFEYLKIRKCTNFTGDLFNFQPHDARHEEYNKLGMNLQKINNEKDFEKSFLLVDDFYEAKKHTLKEVGLNDQADVKIVIPQVENNILKMRTGMRSKGYLNHPEEDRAVDTIENVKMNEDVKDIIRKANHQRRKDVVNVLRYNDFSYGFSNTDGKLDIFAKEDDKKNAHDLDHQIKILMKTVSGDEKELLEKELEGIKTDNEKENFIECILAKDYE